MRRSTRFFAGEVHWEVFERGEEVNVGVALLERLYKLLAQQDIIVRHGGSFLLSVRCGNETKTNLNLDGFALVAEHVAHAANLRAYATQLLFDVLVAAIHVVDAVENRFAVGDHRGQNQRGRGAQVRAHDGRGGERRLAAHGCGASVELDIGAHADELLNVHEAVLEDVLCDDG